MTKPETPTTAAGGSPLERGVGRLEPERDVLDELHEAAARKWQGDPAAQRAGLFARAAAEIERLRLVAADAERWAAECNRRDDHLSAWHAACDVIDAYVADPYMTPKMVRTYAEFRRWREHLKPPNVI